MDSDRDDVRIAVIGGSGLYNMPQLTDVVEREISTPFGPPSDSIIVGTLNGVRVAFLPRHGRGHIYLPHEVPYRANIYALKSLGVREVIAVSACGSLREDFSPGHVVIPDQLFDWTKGRRETSFFGDGLAAHVGVEEPFCRELSGMLIECVEEAGGIVHEGGAFVTIEGPRFSTKAESNVFRALGMSIIGMTTSPEAFLAREAEMCYAVMAHVTDYDVWHETEQAVTVDQVVRILQDNIALAQEALVRVVARLAERTPTCKCDHALESAIITDRRKVSPEVAKRLGLIVGKYL
ncbi:MAG: S-methyl-5'-thioadenosine phosphorylase [Aggregatilineales bacterium]|nr:S-methyl-5'-thioadenosine phosphorylase [Chloroflexota bacterium]HPV08484.1 S-methyl-5'-thioadenosine phosphorylase [Aggregatilineales bacterium]